MAIGIIGLGAIGGSIANLLVDTDYDAVGYDVVAVKQQELAEIVAVASSPCEVAEASDMVLVAVFDDQQVRDALTGEEGILTATRLPESVVLLSTISLETVRWAAAESEARGVALLDCGVSRGGNQPGPRKTLVAMVGGDTDAFAAAKPALEAWAEPVLHMGPLGSGMATKVVRNMMFYSFAAVAWEGAQLAAAAGLDVPAFLKAADACDRQGPIPYGLLERGIGVPPPLSADVEAGKRFALYGHKDFKAAFDLADEVGTDVRVARLVDGLFDEVSGLD